MTEKFFLKNEAGSKDEKVQKNYLKNSYEKAEKNKSLVKK